MNRKTVSALLTALVVGYAGSSSGYTTLVSMGNAFAITRLYSDASGDAQFIQLEPIAGGDESDRQTVPRLMVTNRYGVTKLFTLTHASGRSGRMIVVSQGLAATVPPGFADEVMPDQFLPTDGGTLSFGSSDRWAYEWLPADGSSVYRDGSLGDALMRNTQGQYAYAGSGTRVIYEFYNASLDQYFMSGAQPDIDALDSGRIPGWTRTGEVLLAPTDTVPKLPDVRLDPIERGRSHEALPGGPDIKLDPIERGEPVDLLASIGLVPVCRYLLPTGSHFFSASAAECDVVAKSAPGGVLETSSAFRTWLPLAASGTCPAVPEGASNIRLVPVYRLWNGHADSNHRYTTDPAIRAAMLKAGWIAEGYGNEGVAMCVPSSAALF